MAQASAETAKRVVMKASEVCDRAKVQPYVLRTWEMEFPDLGVTRTPGGPRLYRPSDVEQVLRIRQLVFEQGLTLAGARRRLEEERAPDVALPFDDPDPGAARGTVGPELRAGLSLLKQEMRALLDVLSQPRGNGHPGPVGERPEPKPAAEAVPELPDHRAGRPPAAPAPGKTKSKAAGKRRQAARS